MNDITLKNSKRGVRRAGLKGGAGGGGTGPDMKNRPRTGGRAGLKAVSLMQE